MSSLPMVPAMTRQDVRRYLLGLSPRSPRFVLVCDRFDWSIFVAATNNRVEGQEIEVDFWEHPDNADPGNLFHYSYGDYNDTYSVYVSSVRAIFYDEERAIACARVLKAASEKLAEEMKGPMVTYQMSLLMAVA